MPTWATCMINSFLSFIRSCTILCQKKVDEPNIRKQIPVTSATGSIQSVIIAGKLKGVIPAQTPSGSRIATVSKSRAKLKMRYYIFACGNLFLFMSFFQKTVGLLDSLCFSKQQQLIVFELDFFVILHNIQNGKI